MANYAINGFGPIGRNVLRAMTQKQVEQVQAINDLTDTHTLAHLLKWDSVHHKFNGEIGYDEENIIVRGYKIKIFKERDPANLPWKKLDVDVVLESTGFFTDRDKAELHIGRGRTQRGMINGGPLRAPTPNRSVTDFSDVLSKDATVNSVNAAFKDAASDKSYKGVVEYTDEELLCQDIIGNPPSCIFDCKLTMMLGNRFGKV